MLCQLAQGASLDLTRMTVVGVRSAGKGRTFWLVRQRCLRWHESCRGWSEMNATKCLQGLVCMMGLLAAPAAWADIPPPGTCFTEHEACDMAGENFDQPGVCTATTCTKGPPGQQVTYDCLLCELEAGGAGGEASVAGAAGTAGTPEAGGASGTAGSAPKAGAAGAPVSTPSKDDGGCSVGALGSEKSATALMLGLGLAALGISRRRRH